MPDAKKILYVITQGAWGGAQRYVYDLAAAAGRQFEVTVAVGEPGSAADLQDRLARDLPQVAVVQLRHLVRRISPYHDIAAVFELKKLFRFLQPDIIHLNSSKAGIIGALARPRSEVGSPTSDLRHPISDIRSRTSVIYTVHGWVFDEPLSAFRKGLYRWLERFTAPAKDRLIVLSKADQHTAINRLGIPESKTAFIHLGLPLPAADTILTRLEARKIVLNGHQAANTLMKKKWIGAIAGYYPTKGLDLLIEAVALERLNLGNCIFFLIGDGQERRRLESLIAERNLADRIFLRGAIPEASRLLPAFELLVIPSRKEGFPLVMLEAAGAGVPTVATAVGGIPEFIEHKRTGLLAAPSSVSDLAKTIVYAINHSEEMKDLAARASDRLKYFSAEQMLTSTLLLYRSLPARR